MERQEDHREGLKRALIIGYGYIGSTVGRLLADRGIQVTAISRCIPSILLRHPNPLINWFPADVTCPSSFSGLQGAFDVVLFSASTNQGGMDAYRRIYGEGLNNAMHVLKDRVQKQFIYLSSTGVYGQDDGEWVDESMPTQPVSDTGRCLVDAEQSLLNRTSGDHFPGIILRLSGIYGPRRGYALKRILQGNAVIERPGDRWVNMIHQLDAARAVISTFESGEVGEIYNVSDEEPVRLKTFYRWLAEKAKCPAPALVGVDPEKPVKRRVTNKKISSRKLCEVQGFRFEFPSYREGYATLLK